MKVEKSCPISKTHNRLRQVHDLWHEVADAYADPDEFVTKLNACVQAARSVTFVLQKEGSRIEGFKSWYAEKQEEMRQDPLMRWLVEARNAIEKQGDLDTSSVAVVSIALTDQEVPLGEIEVSPLVSPEEAASMIKLGTLPPRVQKQAVMVVERRWTVPELPDGELLDTVAHCYGILASVVSGAHELRGIRMQTFGGENHSGRHDRQDHPSGRLPCMLPTREMRSAYWHLGRDRLIEVSERETTITQEEHDRLDQEAKRRYGTIFEGRRVAPGTGALGLAEFLHEAAREMLLMDGYHSTLAWLCREGIPIGSYKIDSEDDAEKVVQIRKLAAEVQTTGADAVIVTAETWLAQPLPEGDPAGDLRAGEREDRFEGLVTEIVERNGNGQVWLSLVERSPDGKIQLDEASQVEALDMGLFAPIVEVWARWPPERKP